jgi:5-methylcytosine-specific restriction endonuclease McrA
MPKISPSRWTTTEKPRYSVPVGQHWHKPDRCKTCIMCEEVKPLTEFYAYGYTTNQGKRSTRYESRCKPCSIMRRKAQSAASPGKDAENARQWRENNADRQLEYAREYRASEAGKKTKARLQRIRSARMRVAGGEDSPEIREIYAEAARVEALVANCPVFDLPEIGKKMHVDHIIPIARGGEHKIGNLQILPIGLNMRKGIKCPK